MLDIDGFSDHCLLEYDNIFINADELEKEFGQDIEIIPNAKTCKITFESGMFVECGTLTKLQILKSKRMFFEKAKNLKVGDYCSFKFGNYSGGFEQALKQNQFFYSATDRIHLPKIKSPLYLHDDMAWIIGFLEKNLYKLSKLGLTIRINFKKKQKDNDFYIVPKNRFMRTFDITCSRQYFDPTNDKLEIFLTNDYLIDFFAANNFYRLKNAERRVHKLILQSKAENIRSYFNGFRYRDVYKNNSEFKSYLGNLLFQLQIATLSRAIGNELKLSFSQKRQNQLRTGFILEESKDCPIFYNGHYLDKIVKIENSENKLWKIKNFSGKLNVNSYWVKNG